MKAHYVVSSVLVLSLAAVAAISTQSAADYDPRLGVVYNTSGKDHWDSDDPADVLSLYASAGIDIVRMGPAWGQMEPSAVAIPDTFVRDRILSVADSLDIDVLALLLYGTAWAAGDTDGVPDVSCLGEALGNGRPPLPAHYDRWAQYVGRVTSAYADYVDYYEIWNEPDLTGFFYGDVPEYVDLLAIADSVISANDPTASIVLGGLAFPKSHGDSWLKTALEDTTHAKSVYDMFDILGVHAYASNQDHVLKIVKETFASLGLTAKPVWVTETGEDSAPNDLADSMFLHEHSQVDYVHRTLARWRDDLVEAVFWFNAWDFKSTDPNKGLVDSDQIPKPAFGAFATWAPQTYADSLTVSYTPSQGGGIYNGIYPVEATTFIDSLVSSKKASYAPLDSVYIQGVKKHSRVLQKDTEADFSPENVSYQSLLFDVDNSWHFGAGHEAGTGRGIKIEVDILARLGSGSSTSPDVVLEYSQYCPESLDDWVFSNEELGQCAQAQPSADSTTTYADARIDDLDCQFHAVPLTLLATGSLDTYRFRIPDFWNKDFQSRGADFRLRLPYDFEQLDVSLGDSVHILGVRALWGPPPEISLSAVGPHYTAGVDTLRVSWTAFDAYDSTEVLEELCLVLSRDGGLTYPDTLVASASGTDSLAWPVVAPGSTSTKLGMYAKDIDGFETFLESQEFGIGVPLIGNVPSAASDTLLAYTAYIHGDITIPSGKTLRIQDGTDVIVLNEEPSGGVWNSLSEITVKGELRGMGTAQSGITITAPDSAWGGIVLNPSSGAVRAELVAVELQFAKKALSNITPSFNSMATLLSSCTITDAEYGIYLSIGSSDSLVVTATAIAGIDSLTGVGVYAVNTGSSHSGIVSLGGGATIADFEVGALVSGLNSSTIAGSTISACQVGIYALPQGATGPGIGPNVEIEACDTGIMIGANAQVSGSVELSGVNVHNVLGSGLVGVSGHHLSFGLPGNSFWENGLHGLHIQGGTATTITGVSCDENTGDGIRVSGMTVTVGDDVACVDNGGNGIYLDNTTATVSEVSIDGNGVGIINTNGSSLNLRDSKIFNATTCIVNDLSSTVNGGTSGSNGGNTFVATSLYVANFNTGHTVSLVGNCFKCINGKVPKYTMFTGSVTYTPVGTCPTPCP